MGSRAQDPVEISRECQELLVSVRLEKVFRIPPGKKMLARSLLLLLPVCGLHCLDYGGHGVWDSPMATDYWVKRFGFMWAGGRSGMKGMEALQKTADLTYSNEIPTSIYNPSGIYGLKAMGAVVPEAPHQQEAGPSSGQGEEDGQAGPAQDGPHPLLRQVHGGPLALRCAGHSKQA